MKIKLFFLLQFFFILLGCKNEVKKDNSSKEVIVQLIKKYPELASDTIENYHLVRTVVIGDKNIKVKLYSCKKANSEEHQIIILNNNKQETYAIPLFPNSLRKYWNFENEVKTFKNDKYNSLFEKEFIHAINLLQLNDTMGTGNKILFEIFHSLLHYQQINEFDKEFLQGLGNLRISSNSHSDKDMESELRNNLNCNQVLKGIIKSEFYFEYNALYDTKNVRVFQIELSKSGNKKIKKLNIKTYRFGCEVKTFTL